MAPLPGPNGASVEKDEDLEKKRIKEEKAKEKAREKEAKKAKAAAKAVAAAKAAECPAISKKAEQKAKKAAAAGGADEAREEHPPTISGEKKNLSPEMAKSYNPKAVEASWYEWWEKSNFFRADEASGKPSFVMVVPPPNVTGALHIGHALTASIEDTVCRWRRMSGYNVCWVPGVDHAGIATQVVVEKKIMKERGLTRHDLGRETFVNEVWKWKNEYGDRICVQLRKMGASLDWSRECFTMDDRLSKAVREAFVQLYRKGLIYRDNRLVNWDCILKTAVSDIEVDYKELAGRTLLRVPGYDEPVEFGCITSFAYPLLTEGESEGEGEIVVATTRPETMLGDTAVAVHPEDLRYKHLHGRKVKHPFNGRVIPIICDAELVKMDFGTGAVKITPAHDPNDFATGKRHNLEFINVFTDDGKMNSFGGPEFAGMKRFDCRKLVVQRLEEMGLYRGAADNPMSLGFCSRSSDVIEPMIKPQWYISCKNAAAEAIRASDTGTLQIIPDIHVATWKRWLGDIRDWCISRQLWWGHQIPAWYVFLDDDKTKEFGAFPDRWIVARSKDEAEKIASEKYAKTKYSLEQDPDVLDTWFSSGLFPFSVFGWPERTKDLEKFYPTNLLETGHDILFFWVARMAMMGTMLTGHLPFEQVYLHAMVRDAHGRKMSKSLGNVIDPLEVIYGVTLEELHAKLEGGNLDPREVQKAKDGQREDFPQGIAECGCDALRFALVAYTAQSVNINLDILRVAGYRMWCNKLWNAVRFAMINLGSEFSPKAHTFLSDPSSLPFGCQWILSTLNSTVEKTVNALEKYELCDATTFVYSWWQYKLCDVFIEIIKPYMGSGEEKGDKNSEDGENVRNKIKETLWYCLDVGLRLLHPFMPFVTEELWQRLPKLEGTEPTIMLAPYPSSKKVFENTEVEREMEAVEATVKAVRALRVAYGLQKQRPELYVQCKTESVKVVINRGAREIATLATLSKVEALDANEKAPLGCAVEIVSEHISVHLLLRGIVDSESEIRKLVKKKEETLKFQESLAKKMQSVGYEEKVPEHVKEDNEIKYAKFAAEISSIEEAIKNFEKLIEQDIKFGADEPPTPETEVQKSVKKDIERKPENRNGSGMEYTCCWDCGR